MVHQTDCPSARATFNAYVHPGANGAHFLIDRDGTIHQTASVLKQTWHVGRLRARCLAEHRCAPAETKALLRMTSSARNRHEAAKSVPDRYPSNIDSLGIEIVGEAHPRKEPDPDQRTFEPVNAAQNASLRWLVHALSQQLGIPMSEVFRHPVVSQKNRTEAATATWQ